VALPAALFRGSGLLLRVLRLVAAQTMVWGRGVAPYARIAAWMGLRGTLLCEWQGSGGGW
jgi:hypothetical protein